MADTVGGYPQTATAGSSRDGLDSPATIVRGSE